MKKRTSKLEGSPITLMDRLRDDKKMLHDYFYWDSPVYHAIQNHINKRKTPYFIEVPANATPRVSSAHGSVHFKDAWTYHSQLDKNDKFYYVDYYVLEFDVTWLIDSDYEDNRQYEVRIPFDLEDNFTEEKFAEWVKKSAFNIESKVKDREMKSLEELVAKYPNDVKKLLKDF